MATICSALATPFTPAAGDFVAQVSGSGIANLLRRNTAGAAWVLVPGGSIAANGAALVVSNPIASVEYQFTTSYGTPTVQADQ